MLEIQNITKHFGTKQALKNVSFEVPSGEIFALIGPNGSGKTTLTKILAGLLQPSAGTATIAGFDIHASSQQAKSVAGYIPDNPTAWSEMTGREFLHFTGVLYGMNKQQRKEKISQLLPVFNLTPIADSLFANYSRGNRQKFSILSAFLHDPEVILVDEPIVGLDQESVSIMKNLFTDFSASGGSVLITTHTLPVVEGIGDRFGILRAGSIVASGTISELRDASTTEAGDLVSVYESLLANTKSENA